ncbi:hypothetical protein D4S03_00680 [bacterium]|nr:MAG: hypothetical protein D4S03_00680 [bacterium]
MDVGSVIKNIIQCDVAVEGRIGGGLNSRVYKVRADHSVLYCAKFYHADATDSRDRLGTEFHILKYLWENGVRCIPQPLFMDTENQCAIFEFVHGEEMSCGNVHESDIDQATQFLICLNKLSRIHNVKTFPPASEACFSIQAIIKNIEERLQKLKSIPGETFFYEELQEFLRRDFRSSLSEISKWCELKILGMGFTPDREIPEEERTLSPSDFGYHNALRLHDKRIVFLDFEYFGWDDPAKMICDFLLHPHPAMQFSRKLKTRYVDNLLRHFKDKQNLKGRIEIAYPLFGLKWCMILLNEFVPELYRRRDFANAEETKKSQKLTEQLVKARTLHDKIKKHYAEFPYSN